MGGKVVGKERDGILPSYQRDFMSRDGLCRVKRRHGCCARRDLVSRIIMKRKYPYVTQRVSLNVA